MARRRRAARFGLRALFVVVTVLCIWIGMWASRARQQRLAVERIEGLNGSVTYDCRPDELRVPNWIRRFLGDGYFLTVEAVRLNRVRVEGQRGHALRTTELEAAVSAMKQLPKLRSLEFVHTGIRDDDFAILAPLSHQLEVLNFNEFHGDLTGSGLRHLCGWSRLKELRMGTWDLDVTNMSHFVEIPNLQRLSLGPCFLDRAAFIALGNCRQLRALTLYQCHFTGESLAALNGSERLESILLHNTGTRLGVSASETPSADFLESMRIEFYGWSEVDPMGLDLPSERKRRTFEQWLEKMLPGVEVSSFWNS